MARPLRIQFENAYYHITCRGNSLQKIFADDFDRKVFVDLLGRSREIGELMGVDYSSVSVGRKRLEEGVEKDRVLGKKMADVERVICQE